MSEILWWGRRAKPARRLRFPGCRGEAVLTPPGPQCCTDSPASMPLTFSALGTSSAPEPFEAARVTTFGLAEVTTFGLAEVTAVGLAVTVAVVSSPTLGDTDLRGRPWERRSSAMADRLH